MTLHPVGVISSAANPLVSIVWFGKNRLQWVEKEVGGILRQDHAKWQLVVEDAGSTDGTLEWFRGLAERDWRVSVVSAPGSGPGEALLSALRRCTGDYIAVCPRHAGFSVEAFESALRTLDRSPEVGAVACRGLLVDSEGVDAPVDFDLVMALFTPLRIALHNGVVRRSALIESGLMRDDWRAGCVPLDLWCRLATDHEIATTDIAIVDGKATPSTGDFEQDPDELVEERMRFVEMLFDKDNFFGESEDIGDARDIPLRYECMANQLGILREELGDRGAQPIERRSRDLADKFSYVLSFDGRAERSLGRWRLMWRMAGPLEVLSWISKPWNPGSSETVSALLLFLATHWLSLCRPFIRAALPRRSRKLGKHDAARLHWLFADIYATQADRYNALGQIATAIRNWRLAEPLGDAMCDSMAVQAELKRPGATEASLAEIHKRWVARHVANVAPVPAGDLRRWNGRRKIRVGYHCAFMHLDTIRYMMANVMRAHDRERFEVFGYSPFPVPDDIAQCFDVLRDTSTTISDPERVIFHLTPMKSHAAFRQMVLADGIDVLVEMTGFSPGHRFPAMAARCAPVQVSFLNHTASSQVPNVDYVLADEVCLPSSNGFDAHYSEDIYRLPGCFFCFDYRSSKHPKVAEPPSFAKGYVTFGCFGFGGKLNRDLLRLWAELLHQIPTARLHLQNVQMTNERSRRFLAERFRSFGIESERLILAPGVDRESLLQVYADIDICLDTWPYCGGNATAEALWHGVPVITLKGDRFASRYGASLLAAAGCEDLVANSAEEYVAIAKRLAGDPARLSHLRHHLREMSIEHGLGDSVRFARRLEHAYVDMLSRAAG
jgi:hypothetical protein